MQPMLRLDDVFYVEDYLEKPVELKSCARRRSPSAGDGNGPLDTIRDGQHVRWSALPAIVISSRR